MQLVLIAVLEAVTGHWATCKLLPTNPPILVWTSHMPLGTLPVVARFHCIKIAPCCWPCVLTSMSLHSTCPVDPGVPTWTTGWGLFALLKKDPEDIIREYASPTILAPAGNVKVDVTRYVPASKNTMSPAAVALLIMFWRATVSSATPFPTAPAERTLLKLVRATVSYCGLDRV